MLPGAYLAQKKDGTSYFRSSITYRGKHISLGSYSFEEEAHHAYRIASDLFQNKRITPDDAEQFSGILDFEKIISILNFRDHQIYFKTPIYLKNKYFLYYLSPHQELKFDVDDLFYYSSHKIMQRKGHLFVNDYGMQVNILSRYGIKNFAVPGKDYIFINGDCHDFRYSNLHIINQRIQILRHRL